MQTVSAEAVREAFVRIIAEKEHFIYVPRFTLAKLYVGEYDGVAFGSDNAPIRDFADTHFGRHVLYATFKRIEAGETRLLVPHLDNPELFRHVQGALRSFQGPCRWLVSLPDGAAALLRDWRIYIGRKLTDGSIDARHLDWSNLFTIDKRYPPEQVRRNRRRIIDHDRKIAPAWVITRAIDLRLFV